MSPDRPLTYLRPRHPDKEIERLLRRAETRGWSFTWRGRYPQGRCPCGAHQKSIHLTPGRAYLKNLEMWFRRLDCWKEEQ